MRAAWLSVALAAAIAISAATGALAAAPRTTLPAVESEVMCVECGTPLSVSQSPVADQERALIRRDIARGYTKSRIEADLVHEYGPAVLAEPAGHGFDLTAWIVPIALALLAAIGVVLHARRWRRSGASAPAAGTSADALEPDDARRLDAELAAYDR
jgi:cytochrome c-type biogenesis protein CcmH